MIPPSQYTTLQSLALVYLIWGSSLGSTGNRNPEGFGSAFPLRSPFIFAPNHRVDAIEWQRLPHRR